MNSEIMPGGYADFLTDLKAHIKATQVRAALAINRELVLLYWRTGQDIRTRQKQDGWGGKSSRALHAT